MIEILWYDLRVELSTLFYICLLTLCVRYVSASFSLKFSLTSKIGPVLEVY